MWIFILLAIIILFEIWYLIAFLVAFTLMRDRMLLWQVGHALLLLIALAYIFFAGAGSANPIIVFGTLIASMVCSLIWRGNKSNMARFLKHYPRGTVDVLLLRKPVVDLKRRVRTK